MALFDLREDVYQYELATFGITYREDADEADQLIIAPGLVNHPYDIDAVEAQGSPVEMLEYLFVDGKLVGFAYSAVAPLLSYFTNGLVFDEFPVSFVTKLFKLGIQDIRSHRNIDDEECEKAVEVYEQADAIIAKMPNLPSFILERIKGYIEENHQKYSVH